MLQYERTSILLFFKSLIPNLKKAVTKEKYIVWYYSYNMSGIGKSTETENRLGIDSAWGQKYKVIINEQRISFGGDRNL